MQQIDILRRALAEQVFGSMAYRIILAGIARLQALLDMEQAKTVEMPAMKMSCAWCLAEQHLPMGEGSHGICPRHAAVMDQQRLARRAARLANVA